MPDVQHWFRARGQPRRGVPNERLGIDEARRPTARNEEVANETRFAWTRTFSVDRKIRRPSAVEVGGNVLIHFIFWRENYDGLEAFSGGIHPDRAAGGDCHHWCFDCFVAAGGPKSPRGGQPYPVCQ